MPRTRASLVVTGVVMAIIIVAFGGPIGNIAMPTLAGLLIVVGVRTIKPADLASVWRTGLPQRLVLVMTFLLTIVINLQYAVLAGVGLSMALYVVGQSNKVTIKRRVFTDDGHVSEVDPPKHLPRQRGRRPPALRQLVLRRCADLSATALPAPIPGSRNTVESILRLRERSDIGSTFIDVLRRYAESLADVGSKLVVVSVNEQLAEQYALLA